MRQAVVVAVLALLVAVVASKATTTTDFEYRSPSGRPLFLRGHFGHYDHFQHKQIVEDLFPLLGMPIDGSVSLRFIRELTDASGMQHVHFQQFVRGIEVDGGKLLVHYDPISREIYALTVSLLPDPAKYNFVMPKDIIDSHTAIRKALTGAKSLKFKTDASLVYLLHEDEGYLAYRADVKYEMENEQRFGKVFASIVTGEKIIEFSHIHTIENRTVFNTDNTKNLPGTVVKVEGGPDSSDDLVNQAYDNAGVCYTFYLNNFGRDSWDGNGSDILSTVHYDKDYNNAFWNGEQMVYGDGDGITFSDFAGDTSVVCHELTHAVVQTTANLRYWRDSGALNEGWADAMGMSAVRMVEGGENPYRWMVGHHCYLAGEALRFMNNPPLDNSSYDWYPTRYTGFLDNGGVHSNSGIANLAFALLTEGGTHPQQKSNIYVNGIGWDNSQKVWYNGLFYMTETTNYSGGRAATETAASKLFTNPQAEASVTAAWEAVGVPASSSSVASFVFHNK